MGTRSTGPGGFVASAPRFGRLADSLPEGFRRAPEFIGLAPPPALSLLFSESGAGGAGGTGSGNGGGAGAAGAAANYLP